MSRILVVDDDSDIALIFAQILAQGGHEVATAFDGMSALRAVAGDRPFNGVLIDLHMPHIDGLALLRRLRRTPEGRNMPVAVVTGNWLVDNQIGTELHRLGAIVWFKPLWEEELLEVARTLVDSSHSRPVDAAAIPTKQG